MKKLAVVFVGLVFGVMSVASSVATEEEEGKSDPMKMKLVYAKDILAGLATEDFELITKSAEALNELGKRRWSQNTSSEYRTQHQVFWFTNEALITAARDKNIDGATLAYTQMTVSCVNCHKVLRAL